MQLTGRQDVEAPIDFVFGQVTDFAAFERQALRRGAEVRRLDRMAEPGPGASWDVRFEYRGRERHLKPEIVAWEPPVGYTMRSATGGLAGAMSVELVPLSRSRTRMTLTVEIEAENLTGRLLVQSLKLARGQLNKRLAGRMEGFARQVEERHGGDRAARG